jgi:hypothetical protein
MAYLGIPSIPQKVSEVFSKRPSDGRVPGGTRMDGDTASPMGLVRDRTVYKINQAAGRRGRGAAWLWIKEGLR